MLCFWILYQLSSVNPCIYKCCSVISRPFQFELWQYMFVFHFLFFVHQKNGKHFPFTTKSAESRNILIVWNNKLSTMHGNGKKYRTKTKLISSESVRVLMRIQFFCFGFSQIINFAQTKGSECECPWPSDELYQREKPKKNCGWTKRWWMNGAKMVFGVMIPIQKYSSFFHSVVFFFPL